MLASRASCISKIVSKFFTRSCNLQNKAAQSNKIELFALPAAFTFVHCRIFQIEFQQLCSFLSSWNRPQCDMHVLRYMCNCPKGRHLLMSLNQIYCRGGALLRYIILSSSISSNGRFRWHRRYYYSSQVFVKASTTTKRGQLMVDKAIMSLAGVYYLLQVLSPYTRDYRV